MSGPNTSSTSTKANTKRVPMPKGGRLWCLIKFLEVVLVISCLLMLVLTQYLNKVVDDFTPVKTESTTEPVEPDTTESVKTTTATTLTTTTSQTPTHSTTTSHTPTHSTTTSQTPKHNTTTSHTPTHSTTTSQTPTHSTTTSQTPNHSTTTTEKRRANEIPEIVIISKDSSRLRDEHLESELMNGDTHVRINKSLRRVKKVSDKEEQRNGRKPEPDPISLNDLLIMFPCSTTLLMVIAMEIFGEMFKDPLSNLSNLILNFLAIVLAITLFTVSLLAYLRTPRVTLILTSILSAFLVVVELINCILLQLS